MLLDGQIVGTWRPIAAQPFAVRVTLLRRVDARAEAAIDRAGATLESAFRYRACRGSH